MKIVPVAEVKARFSAYLNASIDGLVVVTRHGKPVAVKNGGILRRRATGFLVVWYW